jgi:hypothetical protein
MLEDDVFMIKNNVIFIISFSNDADKKKELDAICEPIAKRYNISIEEVEKKVTAII